MLNYFVTAFASDTAHAKTGPWRLTSHANQVMHRVAHQSCCESRFAFSPPEAAECKILPIICTSSSRAAAARDPQPLASPGALGSFPSRTKSPETPSVAYKMVRMVPTPFERCQGVCGAVLALGRRGEFLSKS